MVDKYEIKNFYASEHNHFKTPLSLIIILIFIIFVDDRFNSDLLRLMTLRIDNNATDR